MNATRVSTGPVFWDPNNPNHQNVRPGSLGLLETRDLAGKYSTSHRSKSREPASQGTDNAFPASYRPPTQSLIEIRDAGHMGLGLFAKEAIPRGARILAELPLFAMPAETPVSDHDSDDAEGFAVMLRRNDKDIEDFVDHIALKGLEAREIQAMETLYCAEAEAQDKAIKKVIRKYLFGRLAPTWGRDRDVLIRHLGERVLGMPPGAATARVVDRYARLYAIWQNNRIQCGEGASMASGVFLVASRLNHSCCPNAWYTFNPHTGSRPAPQQSRRWQPAALEMLTTHAIRDIAAGEQILVGYEALSLKLRATRAQRLAEWDIGDCVCALCTDPLVEALQQRAYRLWQAADYWVRPWPLAGLRLAEQGIAPCEDAFEAVRMGEEVIVLLTHPAWNVREMALAEAFVRYPLLPHPSSSS